MFMLRAPAVAQSKAHSVADGAATWQQIMIVRVYHEQLPCTAHLAPHHNPASAPVPVIVQMPYVGDSLDGQATCVFSWESHVVPQKVILGEAVFPAGKRVSRGRKLICCFRGGLQALGF